MGAFLDYFIGSSVTVGDLADNRQKKKAREEKKRNRVEDVKKSLLDLYDPVDYFLGNTPGSTGLEGRAVGVIADIYSELKDAWRNL